MDFSALYVPSFHLPDLDLELPMTHGIPCSKSIADGHTFYPLAYSFYLQHISYFVIHIRAVCTTDPQDLMHFFR